MEQHFKIRTSGRKYIYGVLRGALGRQLVVFVHGFTGHMNEHQFFNAASYFAENGFPSFRFQLYSWEKNARKLHECTLATHAYDLDRVIRYFRRKGVRMIFVVGHSYGGKTILMSKEKKYDGVVLWDPSHRFSRLFNKARYLKTFDAYLHMDDTPYHVLVGRQMVREEIAIGCEESIQEIHVPVKIISAGKGVLVRGGQWYYQRANQPKAFVVVEDATHCFDEEGTEERLFRETLSWLKRFSKTPKRL